jgi:hypothetical protein
MKPIPVASAQLIAEQFDYHQVIVIARAVGDGGGEHVTTYGVNAPNCAAAAQIGDFLKLKVMGWINEEPHEDRRYEALTTALEDILAARDRRDLHAIDLIVTGALLEVRGGPKRQRP